jgi:small subunit ribosomal protein S16
MVKIRLRRVGAKRQPSYRIVVADSEAPRDGRFIENIGFFNPRTEPETVDLKTDRALYWLSVGAQPTDAVRRLLVKSGVIAQLEESRQSATAPAAEA